MQNIEDGTIEHPYMIHNLDELSMINFQLDKHFKLANDLAFPEIDIENIENITPNDPSFFPPIGFYAESGDGTFTGSLDGGSHIIFNFLMLKFNNNGNYFGGLFLNANNAYICNLGLENAIGYVEDNDLHSCNTQFGFLIARATNTTIENCYVIGTFMPFEIPY
jgi:hypothetical protein